MLPRGFRSKGIEIGYQSQEYPEVEQGDLYPECTRYFSAALEALEGYFSPFSGKGNYESSPRMLNRPVEGAHILLMRRRVCLHRS